MTDDGYLDDTARREAKAQRYKIIAITATLLLSVIAVVFLIVIALLIRDTQTSNAPLLPEIKALAQRIDSCVDQTAADGDPVGECYAQAQRNQADIIGKPAGPINTVTVLATYCQLTKGADTVPEILACVDDQLKTLDQNGATP